MSIVSHSQSILIYIKNQNPWIIQKSIQSPSSLSLDDEESLDECGWGVGLLAGVTPINPGSITLGTTQLAKIVAGGEV